LQRLLVIDTRRLGLEKPRQLLTGMHDLLRKGDALGQLIHVGNEVLRTGGVEDRFEGRVLELDEVAYIIEV
jgi:hypothetical protein